MERLQVAETTIGIGMIGLGTVGGGVARLLRDLDDIYTKRIGRRIELRRVLVRDVDRTREHLPADPRVVTNDVEAFFATEGVDIIIEVAGGLQMFDYIERALRSKRSVVTANKSLLAARGPELFAIAREHDVAIAFEASCGGGIPIITALKFGLMANRIEALYGILNGTCNYILTEMSQKGKDFAAALAEAKEAGYAEADPTMDISGQDAAEKLAILASLAFGVKAELSDVSFSGVDQVDIADIQFGEELGYRVKLLAIAERSVTGNRLSLRVRPCFVPKDHLLAAVDGSFNALSVHGHATGHTLHYGRGAGQMPTASAVVSDLLNVASGWYPAAFTGLNIWPDYHDRVQLVDSAERKSRSYLRMSARNAPGVMAKITNVLGEADISISAVLQRESPTNGFVPLVVTIHETAESRVTAAIERIEQLDVIEGKCTCMDILDVPAG